MAPIRLAHRESDESTRIWSRQKDSSIILSAVEFLVACDDWKVQGFGLTLFHLPLGIDLTIIVLPFLFSLPYVVQRQKNLWTGFIVHGLLNGGGFLAVAFGMA